MVRVCDMQLTVRMYVPSSAPDRCVSAAMAGGSVSGVPVGALF